MLTTPTLYERLRAAQSDEHQAQQEYLRLAAISSRLLAEWMSEFQREQMVRRDARKE
jgi:hypothetical protein